MQLPLRLLQIGTLALFAAMIGGLATKCSSPKKLSQKPPWLDDASLRRALMEIGRSRADGYLNWWQDQVKIGYTFSQGDSALLTMTKKSITMFSVQDTLEAMDVLQMRYEVAHLQADKAADFQEECRRTAARLSVSGHHEMTFQIAQDSMTTWFKLFYDTKQAVLLSSDEKRHFQVALETHLQRYAKNNLPSAPSRIDTMYALKILAAEKSRR